MAACEVAVGDVVETTLRVSVAGGHPGLHRIVGVVNAVDADGTCADIALGPGVTVAPGVATGSAAGGAAVVRSVPVELLMRIPMPRPVALGPTGAVLAPQPAKPVSGAARRGSSNDARGSPAPSPASGQPDDTATVAALVETGSASAVDGAVFDGIGDFVAGFVAHRARVWATLAAAVAVAVGVPLPVAVAFGLSAAVPMAHGGATPALVPLPPALAAVMRCAVALAVLATPLPRRRAPIAMPHQRQQLLLLVLGAAVVACAVATTLRSWAREHRAAGGGAASATGGSGALGSVRARVAGYSVVAGCEDIAVMDWALLALTLAAAAAPFRP